jgi:outer membrane protein TolC
VPVSPEKAEKRVGQAPFPNYTPRQGSVTPAFLEILPDGSRQVRLTLTEALRLALANNQGFLLDAEGLDVQLLSLEIVRHGFVPVIADPTLTATYSDTSSTRGAGSESLALGVSQRLPFGGTVGATYSHSGSQVAGPNSYSGALTLSLTQPLLRGAGRRVASESLVSAERNYLYNRGTFEFRRQSLLIAVVETYFGLLQQEVSIRNFERNLETVKKQARRAQIREQFGQVTRIDVFRSQLEVTRAESALAQAREQLKLALDAFKLDLGLPPANPIVLDPAVVEYRKSELTVERAVALALENNPDWKNAPLRMEDARRALELASNDRLPQLDLNASHTWATEAEPSVIPHDLADRSWSVGATLSVPLDRYVVNRLYQQSVIAYRQAQRDYLRQRDRLESEVQTRFVQLRQAELAMEFAERAIVDAEKEVRLAEFDYQRGRATNRDVLDAQDRLLQAQNALQAALVSGRIQQLRLLQFTGVLKVDEAGDWLK